MTAPTVTQTGDYRQRKARALADVLDRQPWGAHADAVARLPLAGWEAVAQLADVSMPSEATRAATIQLIRDRGRARCSGSTAIVPECQVDGNGIARCPDCHRHVLAFACPESDGRDWALEVHRTPEQLRARDTVTAALAADPEIAWIDRLAEHDALATRANEADL